MAERHSTAITVALIGAAATVVAALIGAGMFTFRGGGDPGPGPRPDDAPTDAAVFLSRDSGPGGMTVNVSGQGFRAGERIVLRFHTEQIGTTAASDQGSFANVAVTVPTSFSQFAPQQFMIIASGQESLRSASAPFTISG